MSRFWTLQKFTVVTSQKRKAGNTDLVFDAKMINVSTIPLPSRKSI